MMTPTPPPSRLHRGSVIAITVLFMSFLLIGIVGAAYLLSSHLRLTSLGADYLQATYNAESALELSLYELKHRREGYERPPADLPWLSAANTPPSGQVNTMSSTIIYRLTTEPIEDTALEGGSRKLALYYEDQGGTLHDLKDMRGVSLTISAKSQQAGNCLDVRLVGKYGATGEFESISDKLTCNDSRNITAFTDRYHRTDSLSLGQPYPFSKFIQEHTEVLLLINDATDDGSAVLSLAAQGISTSQTIASPKKELTAEGRAGSSVISKRIKLWQDQLPNLLSRSIVQ